MTKGSIQIRLSIAGVHPAEGHGPRGCKVSRSEGHVTARTLLRRLVLIACLTAICRPLWNLIAAAANTNPPQSDVRDFGAACDGVADDSAPLAAAVGALRGTGFALHVSGRCRLRLAGSRQVWLKDISIVGDGGREFGTAGQVGSTILIDTAIAAPFVASDNWGLERLKFVWPHQTETVAAANGGVPIAYPPLVTARSGDSVQNWRFNDNQVENAYDIIDLSNAAGAGHFYYRRNQTFALRYHLRLRSVGGESWITDNQFTPQAFLLGVVASGTTYLRNYASTHAEALRIEGNGTAETPSTLSVDGMRMTGNYGLLLRYGIHVVGGSLNLATLTADSWDEVSTPLAVESGGGIFATTITGGTWLCQRGWDTSFAAPCLIVDGGAPGSNLLMTGVDIAVVAGPGIVFHATGIGASLNVSGGRIANVGQMSVGNPFTGIEFNAPEGSLTLAAFELTTTATAQRTASGIVIESAWTSVVSGLSLIGWGRPLVYTTKTGNHAVTGSISVESQRSAAGGPAVSGMGAALVAQAGNAWH